MDAPDERGVEDDDPVYMGTVLVPADPVAIRDALGKVIDVVIAEASAKQTILDWGTCTVRSGRAIDADTGEEFIHFRLAVRGLGYVD